MRIDIMISGKIAFIEI